MGVLLDFRSLVAKLAKALDDGIGCGLLSIVGDGDTLLGNVTLNLLDTLLKAEVALDLVLTAGTVHLWLGGYYYGLDVLGHANHCGQHHGAHYKNLLLRIKKIREKYESEK